MNMCLPQGAGRFVFGFALGAALLSAPQPGAAGEPSLTAPTCGGSLRQVASAAELHQAVRDVRLGALPPGSVIRLKNTAIALERDGAPLSLNNISGTSEDCPITLEGAGPASLIDGNRAPDNEQFGHRLRVALSSKDDALLGTEPEILKLASTGMPSEAPINCLKIERSSWIVIQNLNMTGCWPTAVYLHDAQYITVRNSTLSGSTYAVIAHGNSHHLLIENNRWTQDVSGEVWSAIPWGVSHHGSKTYLNGALFGGYNIKGGVVIRGNQIRHAYNGIRIKADCVGKAPCARNMNVEISGNSFAFIRDNSVEPEGTAVNWWVRHNRMRDVHAPFSFDGVRGGPHYVFGNVGWFTEMPEQHCDDRLWATDREPLGKPTAHRECRLHRMGKTFKLGNRQKRPLHIFHNSFLVRSPFVGGGASGPLRAWNNAIEFCEPGDKDVECKAPDHMLETGGRKKLKWLRRAEARSVVHNFRFNVANRPVFPADARRPGFPVAGRWAGSLGFLDAKRGDFRLAAQSPARQAGCAIALAPGGTLTCTPAPDRLAPDVGAYQGARLFTGPAFRHQDGAFGPDGVYVERPRVVALRFDRARPDRFSLHFSVPVALEGPAETVRLLLAGGTIPLTAVCGLKGAGARELACVLPTDEGVSDAQVTTIEVPRTIRRRDGQKAPMTLWAAADPRLRFAD